MDSYTHLDMSKENPIEDLRMRMASVGVSQALLVETWGKENSICLNQVIAERPSRFRVALCFRPDEARQWSDILQQESVVALRIKAADLRCLGRLAGSLESSGKWLLAHAESGIQKLKDELLPLARRYPDLRMYLPHLGWPRRDKLDDNDWKESIAELSNLPNMVMGISAMEHFSRAAYPYNDIAPFAAQIRGLFAPDAVVIGSDYPLLGKCSYAQCMELAELWTGSEGRQNISRLESELFKDHRTNKRK